MDYYLLREPDILFKGDLSLPEIKNYSASEPYIICLSDVIKHALVFLNQSNPFDCFVNRSPDKCLFVNDRKFLIGYIPDCNIFRCSKVILFFRETINVVYYIVNNYSDDLR